MFRHEEETLKRIAAILRENHPDRIEAVYAFGSRVRGDFHEGSDFDVLVLVNDKTPDLEKDIISTFVDEEMKAGLSFTPVIKAMSSFELEKKYNSPFYQNIMKEGVPL